MENKTPEFNVEYTFAFDNGNLTFRYLGNNPNGGYVVFDTVHKTHSKMSAKRFSYLYRFALVGEKKVTTLEEKPVSEEKKTKTVKPATSPAEPSPGPNKDVMLSKVLGLTDIQNQRLVNILGKDKTDIATDIESYFAGDTNDRERWANILKDYNLAIKIATV